MTTWLAVAVLGIAAPALASPPDLERLDEPDEPEEPACGEMPEEEPTSIDVAIALSNRGLGQGRPVEMACEGTWLHYCPPLQASICAASSISAVDTTHIDQVPVEIVATTAATVTFDGHAFRMKGTLTAPDRRAITLEVWDRHAEIRSSRSARAGQLPLPFTIVGPSEGKGLFLVSVPGMLPELASYAGGKLRWAGESEGTAARAAAKAILVVDDGELADAFPRTADVALGDTRYLARLVAAPAGSLCDVGRRSSPAARTVTLAITDRVTGKAVLDQALPPLALTKPCTRDFDRSWPNWVLNAYAPEIAVAANRVLGRTVSQWPRLDNSATPKRVALTRLFGMYAPTVAELARVLRGDRVKLASALDSVYGVFRTDGERLTEFSVRLDMRERLVRQGLRDPVTDLLGKDRAAMLALLGPPDRETAPSYARYLVTNGAASMATTIALDDDIVTRIEVIWVAPT